MNFEGQIYMKTNRKKKKLKYKDIINSLTNKKNNSKNMYYDEEIDNNLKLLDINEQRKIKYPK